MMFAEQPFILLIMSHLNHTISKNKLQPKKRSPLLRTAGFGISQI